jgi:hypothetical protein
MLRPIVIATLVAGTLDILSAFVFAGMAGMTPMSVLQFVASGPFGDAPAETPGWAAAGLAVHYAIMACMAAAYMIAAARYPALTRRPILAGSLYGFVLWILMYWIVRPLRWPALWLPAAYAEKTPPEIAWSVGNALFSHCLLVGIPIALIAARHFAGASPQRTAHAG